MAEQHEFVLTLSCKDTKGIVYAVSGLLFQAGCKVVASRQFSGQQGAAALQTPFAHAPEHRDIGCRVPPDGHATVVFR